ncbi:methyltransferase domain-containing protein [Gammaproteobacteria bacterium]|nr:methyltransferase domain-containing protein [Gammaproteobacteria bacterium]
MKKLKLLHVGCGPLTKANTTKEFASERWEEIRLDIDESVEPDIVASALNLEMVQSDSFDAIYSSHNIEHVFSHEVPIMLKEFVRVLNEDGVLVVNCPNLLYIAELIANDKLTEPAYISPIGPITPLDMIYGHIESISKGNLYMAHKCGFTPTSLKNVLEESGFGSVGVLSRKSQLDIWAMASIKKIEDKNVMKSLLKKHLPITKKF